MEKITSVTVPLANPVEHDGKSYAELTFRRMKARDALVAEGETNQVMAGYRLFAALAGVPVDVILDLDMEDLTKVGVEVAPLMGKPATTVAMAALN